MKIRRVVTGHDQNGKAIVSHDELCTNILLEEISTKAVWCGQQASCLSITQTLLMVIQEMFLFWAKKTACFGLFNTTQVLHHAIIEPKPLTMPL